MASFSKRINYFFTWVTPSNFSEVKLTSILITRSFFWLKIEKQAVLLTGKEFNINANVEKLVALFKLIITLPKEFGLSKQVPCSKLSAFRISVP